MTRFIAIAILLGMNIVVNAQQLPVYSGYNINPYLLNPGVAGSLGRPGRRRGSRAQFAAGHGALERYRSEAVAGVRVFGSRTAR